MKYIRLGYMEEETWDAMSESEQRAFIEQCFAYGEALRKKDQCVRGETLRGARSGATLVFRNGKVSISDGLLRRSEGAVTRTLSARGQAP